MHDIQHQVHYCRRGGQGLGGRRRRQLVPCYRSNHANTVGQFMPKSRKTNTTHKSNPGEDDDDDDDDEDKEEKEEEEKEEAEDDEGEGEDDDE